MTSPPSRAWIILPRPPNRLVPPMTAEATAKSTYSPPLMPVLIELSCDASMMPAIPAVRPHRVKQSVRILIRLTPGRLGVAADRVNVAAETGPAGQDGIKHQDAEHDEDGPGHSAEDSEAGATVGIAHDDHENAGDSHDGDLQQGDAHRGSHQAADPPAAPDTYLGEH